MPQTRSQTRAQERRIRQWLRKLESLDYKRRELGFDEFADWSDWRPEHWERYPRAGIGGDVYFYRVSPLKPHLWDANPGPHWRSRVCPSGDKFKIVVNYFSSSKADICEAMTYAARVDKHKLPYGWLECRSHYFFVWLDQCWDAWAWLWNAPPRLNGQLPSVEWATESVFGRRRIRETDLFTN